MTFIEKVFLCVLAVMYLYDCVFWTSRNEQAFTRTAAGTWKTWKQAPLSFTLAGRSPVLASPFLLHPGFIRAAIAEAASDGAFQAALQKVSDRLNSLKFPLTLCRLQAFFLLVYLPALIFLHRLVTLWPIFLAMVLLVHAALCTFAFIALRRTQSPTWKTSAASILFNPLGATRTFDILSQAFFDQEHNGHKP